MGGPVVDWLWHGFNAVVLSYGQARAGKTTLLLGNDSRLSSSRSPASSVGRQSPDITEDGHRQRDRGHKDELGADGEASEAEGGDRERGGGGGLLRDILRVIFDNVAATSPTAPAASAPTDAIEDDPARQNEQPGSSTTGMVDVLNPLAGTWSPSRHACDSPGDSYDATEGTAESLFGNPAAKLCTAATPPVDPPDIEGGRLGGGGENGDTEATRLGNGGGGGASSRGEAPRGRKGGEERGAEGPVRSSSGGAGGGIGIVVALSAWEVARKNVTDLFVTPPSESGSSSSSNSGSSNKRGLEIAAQSGKSGGAGRSRSRNGSVNSIAAAGDGSRGGGGAAGGGGGGNETGNRNGRGRRRSSRGRSGSDDSSTAGGGGGWSTGYPKGFLTVRAPSLAIALALVDTAQRNSGRRQAADGTPGEPGAGKSGRGGGGGGKRGAATGGAGAATPAAARGHVFFRVVVYNALEETVSTLHVVDLAGGWEVRNTIKTTGQCHHPRYVCATFRHAQGAHPSSVWNNDCPAQTDPRQPET